MAKRKRPRPARKWRHRWISRAAFLSNVASRLHNDVGPYLETIHRIHNHTGTGVGFWALARMIFPVVEAISTVIYRSTSRGGRSRQRPAVRLLRELGFEYPNVAWEMYRHTLMHNDEMASATYLGRQVAWEIRIGGGHSATRGRLAVDVQRLYGDLLEFLERESASSGGTQVWVKESFRFNRGFSRMTRDEMLRLGSK